MRIDPVFMQKAASTAQPASREDAKLRKACQDFESVLVTQMLTKMRESVPKTDLFGSNEKEEMFQGMMDQEIADQMSKTQSLGIADVLYRQLSPITNTAKVASKQVDK